MVAAPTHCWPATHALPAPQRQVPWVAPHWLAKPELHGQHVCPAVPHSDGKLVERQVLPWQHPMGQLVASHTHAPPTQRWPAPHAALTPQRHWPLALHVSAFDVSHAVHVPPMVPQVARLAAWHWTPWQQPVGQLVASQTQAPPTQRWPAAHWALAPQRHWPLVHESARLATQAVHAPPLVPQAARSITRHWFPWQQPLGQVVSSHTHMPPEQRCPVAQAAPAPQRQAPLKHESAFAVSHGLHMPPPVPQAATSLTRHWAPSQQPPGQLVLSQTHAPETQR